MQHCPARAARQLAAAALALVLLLALAAPRAHAALQEKHGIRLLTFDHSQILSIGNQTSGKCSWYALRYARTTSGRAGVLRQRHVVQRCRVVRRRLHRVFRRPVRLPAYHLLTSSRPDGR